MSLRSSGSIADRDKGFSLKMPNVGRTQFRTHRVPAALFREVKRRARVSAHTTPSRTKVNNLWSWNSAIPCAFLAYWGTTLLHYKACCSILGSSQDLIHPHGLILPEGSVLFIYPVGISEQYLAFGHDHFNIPFNALLINQLITGCWSFLQRF